MKKIQIKQISKKAESEETERLNKLDTFENEILPVFLTVVSRKTGFSPPEILEFFHQSKYWLYVSWGYTPIEKAFEFYKKPEKELIFALNFYFKYKDEAEDD